MFEIEQSVADWRQQMLAAGIRSPVPLEELESHLREQVERHMQAGFSAQTAFECAVKLIGPGDALKGEFEKFLRPGCHAGTCAFFAFSLLPSWFLSAFGLCSPAR
jgi:hypothetical protein